VNEADLAMQAKEISKEQRENGTAFLPRYDEAGLVCAFVTDSQTGKALMLAHMNEEALRLSLETGEAHFWSRSRGEIWHKGATSGNVLVIEDIRIDCDQDAVWISAHAKGHGAACHTGRKSCFYRRVGLTNGAITLEQTGEEPMFDPANVYGE